MSLRPLCRLPFLIAVLALSGHLAHAAGDYTGTDGAYLNVTGTGASIYKVLDAGGKQVGWQNTGQKIRLKFGDYSVAIGDAKQAVKVTDKGAAILTAPLVVPTKTHSLYRIRTATSTEGQFFEAMPPSGKADLLAGDYDLCMGASKLHFKAQPPMPVLIQPASLTVPGKGGTPYKVTLTDGKSLVTEGFTGSVTDLLPGTYQVRMGPYAQAVAAVAGATISAGASAVTLSGKSGTPYEVWSPDGKELVAKRRTNEGLSLLYGIYLLRTGPGRAMVNALPAITTTVAMSTIRTPNVAGPYVIRDPVTKAEFYTPGVAQTVDVFPGATYEVKKPDGKVVQINVTEANKVYDVK